MRQIIQELMQMALDGLDGFLQNKKHQHRKGQLSLPREVFGPYAVASQKICIAQFGAQCLDKGDEMVGNVMEN